MMVDIYFDKELADVTFEVEALDEWKQTCEQLGLTNQLELTKGKNSPIPYPFINEVMTRVYKELCPTSYDITEYKCTSIPLEVLKQIAFCKKEGYFEEIKIWADNKKPDPVVVGYYRMYELRNSEYNYKKDEAGNHIKYRTKQEAETNKDSIYNTVIPCDEAKYLIARFGDELKPFDELKKLARERFIAHNAAELKRDIAVKQEKLKTIEEQATSYFNGTISKSEATTYW